MHHVLECSAKAIGSDCQAMIPQLTRSLPRSATKSSCSNIEDTTTAFSATSSWVVCVLCSRETAQHVAHTPVVAAPQVQHPQPCSARTAPFQCVDARERCQGPCWRPLPAPATVHQNSVAAFFFPTPTFFSSANPAKPSRTSLQQPMRHLAASFCRQQLSSSGVLFRALEVALCLVARG